MHHFFLSTLTGSALHIPSGVEIRWDTDDIRPFSQTCLKNSSNIILYMLSKKFVTGDHNG